MCGGGGIRGRSLSCKVEGRETVSCDGALMIITEGGCIGEGEA